MTTELTGAAGLPGGSVPVSALVIGDEGTGDLARTELAGSLDRDRRAALADLLLERAVGWAQAVARGPVRVAGPAVRSGRVRHWHRDDVVIVPGAEPESPRWLGETVRQILDEAPGPVLITWAELPRWRPEHAAAALDDLRVGDCEVSVGPLFGGGLYLLALRGYVPRLFELPSGAWRSLEAMGLVLSAAHDAGAAAGLVRPERGLRTPADVRAARADPLLDPELAALLAPA